MPLIKDSPSTVHAGGGQKRDGLLVGGTLSLILTEVPEGVHAQDHEPAGANRQRVATLEPSGMSLHQVFALLP
ncbi:hypothetical protein [Halomonas sp. RT37]|uniref:Uncharacterized protein n=1 Tax=Halomonas sp. RT37 TaxID=2950872 RepID=A0AAU7KJI8_9GAMM